MRSMLVGSLVVALAQTIGAESQQNLDAPVGGEFRIVNPLLNSPCTFGAAVDQLARRAHVLVGFENTPDCWMGAWTLHSGEGALDLTGMTARQALDHLVALTSTYRWQEIDGVVVIRPIAAWDDPTNMLNRPTASFNVTNANVHEVLHVLLQAVTPSLFYPHTDLQLSSHGARDRRLSSKYIRMMEGWEKNGRRTNPSARTLMNAALAACGSLACDGPNDPSSPTLIDAPVSVAFPGGTMLDALSAVTRAHRSAIWRVGYLGNRADIELSTLDYWGGHAGISTAPLVLPQRADRRARS
jgi:hypothetical protein